MRKTFLTALAFGVVIGAACNSGSVDAPQQQEQRSFQPQTPANFDLALASQTGGTWYARGRASDVIRSLQSQATNLSTIAQAAIQAEVDAVNAQVAAAAPGRIVTAEMSGAEILDANGKASGAYTNQYIATLKYP